MCVFVSIDVCACGCACTYRYTLFGIPTKGCFMCWVSEPGLLGKGVFPVENRVPEILAVSSIVYCTITALLFTATATASAVAFAEGVGNVVQAAVLRVKFG